MKKQNELTEEVNTISLYANNEIYIQQKYTFNTNICTWNEQRPTM